MLGRFLLFCKPLLRDAVMDTGTFRMLTLVVLAVETRHAHLLDAVAPAAVAGEEFTLEERWGIGGHGAHLSEQPYEEVQDRRGIG